MKILKLLNAKQKWLILPPILLGLAITAMLVKKRGGPVKRPPTERARTLRVIEVPTLDISPRVIGYGTAEPGKIWRAVAQVKGRVISTYANLQSGALIDQNEVVLRIDPAEYELTLARLNAERSQVDAQISELNTRATNEVASLAIDEKSLEVAIKQLERSKGLVKKNAVSQVQVEKDEASVLTQRQSIQARRNNLSLFGSQRKTSEANLALIDAKIAQAKIDLTNTVIRAPFPARFGQVNIEPGQYLNASEQLFEAYATSLAEVPVQISANRAHLLFPPGQTNTVGAEMNMERLHKLVNIDAVVRADSYGIGAEWQGRFARVRESVDVKTRMISFVIAVDDPFAQAIPGRRPPLTKGVYCEVELIGPLRKGLPVVPRSAVRDGKVFVLDAEQRLRSQPIRLDFANGDYVAIADGLSGGETIVVSDPTPAIEGMLVDPVTDETALAQLTAEAKGGKGTD